MASVAGSEAVLGDTLPALLERRAERSAGQIAYRAPAPAGAPDVAISWGDHLLAVQALARSLAGLGIGPGTRVGILAQTSVQWEVAQMAALAVGATVVGLDPNYPDDELHRLVHLTELSALFVQDARAEARIRAGVPSNGVRLIRIEPSQGDAARAEHFDALVQAGRAGGAAPVAGARADGDAVMVFSSGTTGHPKPIVYTHRQVLLAVGALTEAFADLDERSRLLCWLPLANLFQRMINFCAIARGASSYVVGDPRTVMDHLPAAAPHVFIAVPRFFERVHAGIRARLAALPSPVRRLAHWALAVGLQAAQARQDGRALPAHRALQWRLADRLVLRRLRAIFGGQLRYLLSGSAPMPLWLLRFFESLGLPVYEAYGVSENVVPVALNRPGARRLGTVGRPAPGNEVVLAPDGEVRVRGPGVFGGYWRAGADAPRPDADGFWATGDLGAFDAEGFLRIAGRKGDSFKLSTGRWVAPVEVEQRLRGLPGVEHALIVGQARKAVVAVLVTEPGALPEGAAARGELAAALAGGIARATGDLPDYQRPAAVVVTDRPFTIEGGELTANLKLRRGTIASKLAAQIESVYARLDAPAARGVPGATPPVLVHFE